MIYDETGSTGGGRGKGRLAVREVGDVGDAAVGECRIWGVGRGRVDLDGEVVAGMPNPIMGPM